MVELLTLRANCSLLTSKPAHSSPYLPLILVDNGSTDSETLDYIEKLSFPDTDFIRLKKLSTVPSGNVTATWNTGIKAATGEYVAVLNNDITLSKHWDVHLINALQGENVWLANPYQADPGESTPYAQNPKDGNIAIRGACFMFRKGLMETIGYFPEQLKIWFSDMWFAWVITKKHQKQSVFVDQSVIYHYGSKSSREYDIKSGQLWQRIKEDALAYQSLTGENIERYLKLCEARIRK